MVSTLLSVSPLINKSLQNRFQSAHTFVTQNQGSRKWAPWAPLVTDKLRFDGQFLSAITYILAGKGVLWWKQATYDRNSLFVIVTEFMWKLSVADTDCLWQTLTFCDRKLSPKRDCPVWHKMVIKCTYFNWKWRSETHFICHKYPVYFFPSAFSQQWLH